MSSSQSPRIAISGAGPAGLTLGLLLNKHAIPFTIFELRERPTAEELAKPAGMLDLHEESGLAALRECGLYEDFIPLTGECAEADRVSDIHGSILWADDGEMESRPEISRNALSNLLMSHLPANSIKWGHRLRSAATIMATSGNTETELDFGSHGKQTFDLVIGADGAWSRVRNLFTGVKPKYSGSQCVTLTIRQITEKYPQLAQLVGPGSFMALGLRHGVMSQRGPQDSARLYICLTSTDEAFASSSGLASKTAAEAKDILLNDHTMLGRYGTTIKQLVIAACEEESIDNPDAKLDIRPLYVLPVGHTWNHKPGVTLIGDAAHLMCPWAGEGVNLAMWDSLLLSQAIVRAFETSNTDSTSPSLQSALDPLLQEFEISMWKRVKEKAEETERNGQIMFGSDDGATVMANFFKSCMGPREQ